jgi:hypothetical protein
MITKILFTLLILQTALLGQVKKITELENYIQKIRTYRMTEDARSTMDMVSSIRTEHTTLTFVKDASAGTYGTSYGSTFCPLPGADSVEVQKIYAKIAEDVNADREKIRPLADIDHSGFITTEEATRFRKLIEFGLLANFAAKNGEPVATVARSLGISDKSLPQMITDYKDLVSRSANLGKSGIPPWPYKN